MYLDKKYRINSHWGLWHNNPNPNTNTNPEPFVTSIHQKFSIVHLANLEKVSKIC